MTGALFREMPERLGRVLDALRQREVPPFDEARLAQLRPHQHWEAQRLREEHAKRVQRARQRTSDPAFDRLSREDWQWLQAAHLVDVFTVSDDGARTEFVQLTPAGRRTQGYVDHSQYWAQRRRETAATAEAIQGRLVRRGRVS